MLLLLGSGPMEDAPAAGSSQSSELIQTDISQYSVESGRSACTCIALTGANLYLQNPAISSDLLRNMVMQGVDTYQRISQSESGIDHMSAEEVLNQNAFPLQVIGGVRQGVLSYDSDYPLGLKALLGACQAEGARVVLITKTPETVVVCLDQFALLDSHPRPPMASNAYAKTHGSLEDLVQTLQSIFPPTELGSDVPEMMAMMYNSFDLYPLAIQS